jgi:integrase
MIHKPRKLPRPKKRTDGKWEVRWRYKVNGKEHRPSRLFDSEAEANDFILKNLADASRVSPQDSRKAFATYADGWLKSKRRARRKGLPLSASTLETYGYAVRQVNAHFGTWAIADVTPIDVEDFADLLSERGLSRKTLDLIWMAVRGTFRHALKLRAITADPSYAVDPPSADARPARWEFLRPVEVSNLAAAFPHPPYRLLVRFAAYTGLRRGELAGLDLRHITITPPTGLGKTWGGSVRVETNLKTPNARRTVPLPSWLAEETHTYISRHPNRDDPTAPLWPASERRKLNWERRINPNTFYGNAFKTAVKRAGLPEALRLHDLRHTYASLLAADGVRIEVVAKLMGHKDPTITRKIYTHLWPEHLDDAVATLAAPPEPAVEASNVIPMRRTA